MQKSHWLSYYQIRSFAKYFVTNTYMRAVVIRNNRGENNNIQQIAYNLQCDTEKPTFNIQLDTLTWPTKTLRKNCNSKDNTY